VFAAAAAALVSTGCLQKEVTHTIYISPDAVVWSALEKDVRSDEQDVLKRATEEQDYLLAVGAGNHPVAAALRRLGARPIVTSRVRPERPYTVMTEARFADLRQLALALLRGAGLTGDVSLTRDGCRTSFSLRAEVPDADHLDAESIEPLLEDLDRYRLVLTQGRFTSAEGFVIQPDGAVALFDGGANADATSVALKLAWAADSCR